MKLRKLSAILLALIFVLQIGVTALATVESDLTYTLESEDFSSDLSKWEVTTENATYISAAINDGKLAFSSGAVAASDAIAQSVCATATLKTKIDGNYAVQFDSSITNTDGTDIDFVTMNIANGICLKFDTFNQTAEISNGTSSLATASDVLPNGLIKITVIDKVITVYLNSVQLLTYTAQEVVPSFGFKAESNYAKNSQWLIDNVAISTEEPITDDEIISNVQLNATHTVADENFDNNEDVTKTWALTKDTIGNCSIGLDDGRVTLKSNSQHQYTTADVTSILKGTAGAKTYMSYEIQGSTYSDSRVDHTFMYLGTNVFVKYEVYQAKYYFSGFGIRKDIPIQTVKFNSIGGLNKYEVYTYGEYFLLYINGVLAVKIKDASVASYVPYGGAGIYSTTGVTITNPIHIDNYKLLREPSHAEQLSETVKDVKDSCIVSVLDDNFDSVDANTSNYVLTYNYPDTGNLAVTDGRLGIVNASATPYNQRRFFSALEGTAGLKTYLSYDFQGATYNTAMADWTTMYFGENVYLKYANYGSTLTFNGFGIGEQLNISTCGFNSIDAVNKYEVYVFDDCFLLYINGTLAKEVNDPSVKNFVARPGASVESGTYGCKEGTFAFMDNVKLLREKTADEKLESDKEAAIAECTKVSFSEDFETNDISTTFDSGLDGTFYSLSKTNIGSNNVLDLFIGKNGTFAGYGATGRISIKNSYSGNSVTEFKAKFSGGFPEYGFLVFGYIGSNALYLEKDQYSSGNWRFNLGTAGGTNQQALSTISAQTATSINMIEDTDITFKAVAFNKGIFIYANDTKIAAYTGSDASLFVSKVGFVSVSNYYHSRHFYLDDITVKTEPTFEDMASWYLINDDFDTYDNDRITPTESSNHLTYTKDTYEGNNVLKISMGVNGQVNYQIHSGFAIESLGKKDLVINTRMKADPNGIPQGIIIYTGRKDSVTGEDIGLAFTAYRHYYGMTPYGEQVYYDTSKFYNSICGDDAGFDQSQWHAYKLVVNENNIKVYIDDILKIDYNNDNMTEGGRVGIRMTSANFENHNLYVDNYSVKTIGPEESGLVGIESVSSDESIYYKTRYAVTKDFSYDSVDAYLGIYEDGNLVRIVEKTIPVDENMLSEAISASYEKTEGKTYTTKLFTWNNNLKPVFEVH